MTADTLEAERERRPNGVALRAPLAQPETLRARGEARARPGVALAAGAFDVASYEASQPPQTGPVAAAGARQFDDVAQREVVWYVPALTLGPPGSAFEFSAAEDARSGMFDHASVMFTATVDEPAVVRRARFIDSAVRYLPVPLLAVAVRLQWSVENGRASQPPKTAEGRALEGPEGTYGLLFDALMGRDAEEIYDQLTQTGGGRLRFGLFYRLWRSSHAGSQRGRKWFAQPENDIQDVPIGLRYSGGAYQANYHVSRAGQRRPILVATDLSAFDTNASEYRELTSLGDVATKYPSFQRLYLGQISGSVVAIPAAYGIVCDSTGCAARLDALVDSASLSGCRFHFTFTIGARVDPIDLASLQRDLTTIPEAQGRSLTLTLPTGLDSRVAGTLFGTAVTSIEYANSPAPHAFLLSCDITDQGGTPAVTSVNMFLSQLTATAHTPIFGQLGVRLDDTYLPVVVSTAILNLRETSQVGDITTAIFGPFVTLTNATPLDVDVIRIGATHGAGTITVGSVGRILTPGESTTLSPLFGTGDEPITAMVQTALAVPDPLPKASLTKYVAIHTEDIQNSLHPLSINATGIDFVAAGITQLDIQITLTSLSGVTVPSITLTATHRVETVTVVVPVGIVLSGLPASVSISVVAADPTHNRRCEVSTDFLEQPLFVLTSAALR